LTTRALAFVVPGALATLTGGYAYDRRIVNGLRERGWLVQVHTLDASFPQPTRAARAEANEVFSALADDALVLVDGLAFGTLPEVLEQHAQRLKLVALVHHPLAAEHGLGSNAREQLRSAERRALQFARRVIVTSSFTQRALVDYGVDSQRVIVAEPGTDHAPLSRADDRVDLVLTCVATVTPRKGHAVLIDALGHLKQFEWTVRCVGSLDRDAAHAAQVCEQLRRTGLDDRVSFTGELEQIKLDALLHDTDLFVMPTLYEGYGMAVAEALARGIPVIATDTGATSTLLAHGGGLIVPPGDAAALRTALARVIGDRRELTALRQGALAAREHLPAWQSAVSIIANTLESLAIV
jgi:glycosyltransferase involved in cell wall biosynthesis